MKSFIPFILIVVAGLAGFFFIKPLYQDIQKLRIDNDQYAQAIKKGQEFDARIGTLSDKLSQFSPDDLDRLTKMIPDSVDNVRLIIEMNEIAKKYSLAGIKNIRVSESKTPNAEKAAQAARPYGSISLGFSLTTSYDKFNQFLKALETNLRIADVTALSFNPATTGDIYDFSVTVKTHWLKAINN